MNSGAKPPEPTPVSGLSCAMWRPPSISPARPLVVSLLRPPPATRTIAAARASSVAAPGDHPGRQPPAGRDQDAEPGEEGDRAGLREGEDEQDQQDDVEGAGGVDVAGPAAVGDDRGQHGHRHHEVAPEDVGVEEQRVDPEVRVGLVAGDHLVVPEEIAAGVLVDADGDEDQPLDGQHPDDRPQGGRVPLRPLDHEVQGREGSEEEGDVLQGGRQVVGVTGLERVEDDDRGEGRADPPQQPLVSRLLLGGLGLLVLRGLHRPAGVDPDPDERGEHPTGDHRVERQQDLQFLTAAEVDRDPERHGGDQRRGQQGRPLAEDDGQHDQPDRTGDERGQHQRRAVAKIGDPARVPVVAEDQHRGDQQRGRQRGDSRRAGDRQQRNGGEGRTGQRSDPEQRGVHQPPIEGCSTLAGISIRPGGLMSRSCWPSTTSSAYSPDGARIPSSLVPSHS